jgi:hypothetical protein
MLNLLYLLYNQILEAPNYGRQKSFCTTNELDLPYYKGLYGEDHGMVGNYMWDPATGKEFRLSVDENGNAENKDPFWFDQHVPLWASATHQEQR